MFRLPDLESTLEHMVDFQTFSYTIVEDVVMPSGRMPDMTDATFIRCDLTAVIMPEDMDSALFVDCHLQGLTFDRASLFNARFIRCDLSRCRFTGCDLSAAQFEDCRLDNTAFSDSDIETLEIIGNPPANGAPIAA